MYLYMTTNSLQSPGVDSYQVIPPPHLSPPIGSFVQRRSGASYMYVGGGRPWIHGFQAGRRIRNEYVFSNPVYFEPICD